MIRFFSSTFHLVICFSWDILWQIFKKSLVITVFRTYRSTRSRKETLEYLTSPPAPNVSFRDIIFRGRSGKIVSREQNFKKRDEVESLKVYLNEGTDLRFLRICAKSHSLVVCEVRF